MSYLVLARKYRSQDLNDLVGQEHVSQTLSNAIKSGHISHSYLFSGPRGVGKTSTARILAKALNCVKGPTETPCQVCSACIEITQGNSLDVLEIDGASNRGIDEIRSLRENVKFAPTSLKYKIYIIDEVHMLTDQAFNALLKTLEEPPSHTVFIFATTEIHKLPDTILSRCVKFNFKLISLSKITERLKYVLGKENIEYDDSSLNMIARNSQGSMRDALSFLDQVISYSTNKITKEDTSFILGIIQEDVLSKIINCVVLTDTKQIMIIMDEIIKNGYDILEVIKELREYYRILMLLKIDKDLSTVLNISKDSLAIYENQSQSFTLGKLTRDINVISKTIEEMKWSDYPRIICELCLVKISKPYISPEELVNKINNLESVNINLKDNNKETEDIKKKLKTENKVVKKEEVLKTENEVIENWDKIIAEISKTKLFLVSYLPKNKERIIQKENKITLKFNNKFYYNGINKSKDILMQALKDVLNKNYIFKLEFDETLKDIDSDIPEDLSNSEIRTEDVCQMKLAEKTKEELKEQNLSGNNYKYTPDEIIEAEPVVEKVLGLFGGRIQPKI